MTPDQARALLDGTTPGRWRVDGGSEDEAAAVLALHVKNGLLRDTPVVDYTDNVADAALISHAPDMAAMIAGMREEWGIVAVYLGRHEVERWGFDTREDALDEASALDLDELRIVRRYVTEQEEIS